MENQNKKNKKIYLWYTLLFTGISVLFFGQLWLFDKTLIWNIDGYLQWYSLFGKFQNTFQGLFSGQGFPFWDWSIGLGADYFANFAFLLFDPFSYLALFFSKENLDIAYTIIVILKLFAAGMAMLCFLRYHKKPSALCLAGAIGYAFCAWGMVCTRHDFFLTQLIIFPLLILGVDKVEDKRSPLLLIFSVWWSILQSIYFSYMTALFAVIYIVVRFFTGEGKKTVAGFFIKIVKYVGYVLVGGILLTAPVLVPALFSLIQTSKGSGVGTAILPTVKQLLRFVPSFVSQQDIYDNYSIIGMNFLFVSMIPAIAWQLKRRKSSAWMFWICMAFLLLPALQCVTNGFSYASGRWSYVMNFFFVYAAVECLEWKRVWEKSYVRWILLTMGILIVTGIVAVMGFDAMGSATFCMVLLSVVFGAVICYLIEEPFAAARQGKCLVAVVALNCALLGMVYYNPHINGIIDTLMTQGKCYEIYQNNSMRVVSEIEDEEFYRVDTVDYPTNSNSQSQYAHTPANTSLYWNTPGISEYLSTVDGNWIKWNQLLGNSNGCFRRMCTYSNDNRCRMDFLLGVKYFLGSDKKTEAKSKNSDYAGYGFSESDKIKKVSVLQSAKNSSLGYVYDSAMSDTEWKKYSALEREQILMQTAVVEDDQLEQLTNTDKMSEMALVFEDSQNVPFTVETGEGIRWKSSQAFSVKKEDTVKLKLQQNVKNCEIYVLFRNLKKKSFSQKTKWKISHGGDTQADELMWKRYQLSQLSQKEYENFSVYITRDEVTKRILNAEGEPQGVSDNEDYMANTGYADQYEGEISCHFDTPGKYTCDDIQVIAVPVKQFDQQAKVLEDNRLTVTKKSQNQIEGTVDTEKGGLLYLNILYNKGWKIFVDGKEAKQVYNVNTAFMGVEVPEGSHTIRLEYQPLGSPYTWILFGLGVVITGVLGGIGYAKKKKHKGDTLQ